MDYSKMKSSIDRAILKSPLDVAAYDDKCKYPCSYQKDFEQLKNDK